MDNQKWYSRALLVEALKESIRKLDPRSLIANPVMFVVEVGFVYTLHTRGLCRDSRKRTARVHRRDFGDLTDNRALFHLF